MHCIWYVVRQTGTLFEAHPKRQLVMEKVINETQPESHKKKLGDLCRSRWVQRLNALETSQKLHPSVIACMAFVIKVQKSGHHADSILARC